MRTACEKVPAFKSIRATAQRSLLRKVSECFGDSAGCLVTFVQQYAVPQAHRFAAGERVLSTLGAGREVMQPEGIGREQAVGSHVPVRREAEAGGMIQDGEAQLFAFNGAMIIDPRGWLAPGGAVAL